MGGLLIGTNPNALTLPLLSKLWITKTPTLNYSHTVADGATLRIFRRCEVIVAANAPKY